MKKLTDTFTFCTVKFLKETCFGTWHCLGKEATNLVGPLVKVFILSLGTIDVPSEIKLLRGHLRFG
jgi:hypothetical protein